MMRPEMNIMTTNSLCNQYLYEVEGEVVDVYKCVINQDNEVVVISEEDHYYFIPLLDYITFVFNKSFSGDL